MIFLETIAKIRRDHFVRDKGITQVNRERGLRRNPVRKNLAVRRDGMQPTRASSETGGE